METTTERINPHTSENQRICGKLVDRDVIYCVSSWVSVCLEHPDSKYIDELSEVLVQDDWEQAARDSSEWANLPCCDPDGDGGKAELEASGDWQDFCDLHNIEPYTVEALEHWLVSSWLADKLEAQGEMILRDFMGFEAIWGRICSGQAILLDGVIGEIAESMEILQGQRNEWKQDR